MSAIDQSMIDEGVIVQGPHGDSINAIGYREENYWCEDGFTGPDRHGVVPVYRTAKGGLFPRGVWIYPHAVRAAMDKTEWSSIEDEKKAARFLHSWGYRA